MGKNQWKIFRRGKDDCFYVIEVPNDDWRFQWALDAFGDFQGWYWDKAVNDKMVVRWKQFQTGEEAAEYIKEIDRKLDIFYFDATKEYL